MKNMYKLPKHVAIIPDGNRRWAKEKGKPTAEGHRYAAQTTLPNLISELIRLDIEYFTFWALSTENLTGRSKEELSHLFNLIRISLKSKYKEFKEKKIRLKIIGDLIKLPEDLQEESYKITKETINNKKITIVLGLNYGGRDEIIRAIITQGVKEGQRFYETMKTHPTKVSIEAWADVGVVYVSINKPNEWELVRD